MLGTTLGHYRILEKLGEGGMGVVYKARDTHLDRSVALKVLPADATADPARRGRFVQEAKAASALNHPNIVHIYDIGADAGVSFIAMEFVSGQTIEAILRSRPMPSPEALKYAIQIADALAAAHEAGIVHRDLKPGNIMVNDRGVVKILDFGLAKLIDPPAADEHGATMTASPRTEAGTIMGTVAYMSPEQAEARNVDARSDIFAFGSVLYEMLTARRAFTGESRIATLAAIIRDEPAPIGESIPEELGKAIGRCLRKDPSRRFQTMSDLKATLEDFRETSASARVPVATPPPRRKLVPLAAAGVAVVVIAAFVAWWKLRDPPSAVPTDPPVRLTSDSGLTTDPALSPDGKLIAYASDRAGDNLDIWIQRVETGQSNRLTTDSADEREPAFSPDGASVVFRSEKAGSGIYEVPAIGGPARLLAPGGRRPRYSPDGKTIAYYTGTTDVRTATGFRTYVVDARGGTPRQLAAELKFASHPVWSPDGRKLLVYGHAPDEQPGESGAEWRLVDFRSGGTAVAGMRKMLREAGFAVGDFAEPVVPAVWIGDDVVFSAQRGDSTNIWRARLPSGRGTFAGAPVQLTFGAGVETAPSAAMAGEKMKLAFAGRTSTVNIWSLPLAATGTAAGDPQRLTSSAYDAQLSASADGRLVAWVTTRAGTDVMLKDLSSGRETAITSAPGDQFGPVLTRDGSRLAYHSIEKGNWIVHMVAISAAPDGALQAGPPEVFCPNCPRLWELSRDGRTALSIHSEAAPNFTVGLFEKSTGMREWLRIPNEDVARLRLSPDDQWLAFVAMRHSESSRILLMPFGAAPPPQDRWIVVSEHESVNDKPYWSPDGNMIYYTSDRDGFRCLMARRLDPATKKPAGPSFDVFHSHRARRSMLNVSIIEQEIAVVPGKLLFSMGEITGNIWMK